MLYLLAGLLFAAGQLIFFLASQPLCNVSNAAYYTPSLQRSYPAGLTWQGQWRVSFSITGHSGVGNYLLGLADDHRGRLGVGGGHGISTIMMPEMWTAQCDDDPGLASTPQGKRTLPRQLEAGHNATILVSCC